MKISKYTSYFSNRIFRSREHYPRQYRGIVFARRESDKSGWYGYESVWILSPIFSNFKEIYMKELKEEIERPMPHYITGETSTKIFVEDRKFDIESYELFKKLPVLDIPRQLLTSFGGLKMAKITIDGILERNEGLEDKLKKIIKESK